MRKMLTSVVPSVLVVASFVALVLTAGASFIGPPW
jgi:hypothetical protein